MTLPVDRVGRAWSRLANGFREAYSLPYRRTLRRAQRDQDDLFMTMVIGEALGLPNPAGYYAIEVMPIVLQDFHRWHRRMGMDRSPLGSGLSCC